ncbi:MAG: ABC transporter permease [Anaerolineae bacterium]|nr:MAG: ABC transporter permease [Anaerolineae bacterium]
MKALSIAFKDLQIFFRDRGIALSLFLLPLVFVVAFTGALGAIGKGEEDARIPLSVVNLDGGQSAQTLIDDIDAAGGVRVEPYEQAEAMALLDEGKIDRLLIVPAGFTAGIASGQPVTLRFVSGADADVKQAEAVRLVVEGVVNDMSLEIQILAALQQMGEMQAGVSESPRAFTIERMQAQARSQFERAQAQPLIAVAQREPAQEVEQEGESLGLGDIAVPGIAVLFVFMAAQNTARSIYDEKKVGSFRRLLAAPMSKAALLVGKMLPNFITGFLQVAVIFAFGIVGLKLLGLTPATLGNDPLATVLVVALLALCSSAFGILIAAFARTEGQIGGLSTLLVWGMGLVGGSIIPLFILEKFLGPVPMVVPHYWANRALVDLMVRGRGLADVTTEMAALLGFTVLFFAIGLWRFEFD